MTRLLQHVANQAFKQCLIVCLCVIALQCALVGARPWQWGSYKCECRQGYEYPFNDERTWYFDGPTMQDQYMKMINGTGTRYSIYCFVSLYFKCFSFVEVHVRFDYVCLKSALSNIFPSNLIYQCSYFVCPALVATTCSSAARRARSSFGPRCFSRFWLLRSRWRSACVFTNR